MLRRPASVADAGSGIAARGFISGVFVHYIRLVRVVDGSPYYLYPGIVGGCGTGEAAHQGLMELATNVNLGHGLIGGSGTIIWRSADGRVIKTFDGLGN